MKPRLGNRSGLHPNWLGPFGSWIFLVALSISFSGGAGGCRQYRMAKDVFAECQNRKKSEAACVEELCLRKMTKKECLKELRFAIK